MLSRVEHKKSFINSGPDSGCNICCREIFYRFQIVYVAVQDGVILTLPITHKVRWFISLFTLYIEYWLTGSVCPKLVFYQSASTIN